MNVILMAGEDQKDQAYWFLQIIIAVAFKLIILEVLDVYLAKSSDFIFKICKFKGFYYDKDLHEDVARYIGDK